MTLLNLVIIVHYGVPQQTDLLLHTDSVNITVIKDCYLLSKVIIALPAIICKYKCTVHAW